MLRTLEKFFGIKKLINATRKCAVKSIIELFKFLVRRLQIWWKHRMILDSRRKQLLCSEWDARLELMINISASRKQKKLTTKLKSISNQKRNKIISEYYQEVKIKYIKSLRDWIRKREKAAEDQVQLRVESVKVTPGKLSLISPGKVQGKVRLTSKEVKKVKQKVKKESNNQQAIQFKYIPTDTELENLIMSAIEP